MKTTKNIWPMKTLVVAFMLLAGATFAQSTGVPVNNVSIKEDVPSTANLDKFTATYNEGIVKINWVLTSQEAQAKLIIEKSADGINYSYMGKLPAIASPNKITYSCRDNAPADGGNYYRLKTVTADNTEYIYDDTAFVNTREKKDSPKQVLPLAAETPITED